MYVDETLLSLMIMALYLASGYCDRNIYCPETEKELASILNKVDKNEKLSVIYLVMDNTDDKLFRELAYKYEKAVFIKVNTTVVKLKGRVLELERQPHIVFHKYGMEQRPFFCNNESRLGIMILYRINVKEYGFRKLCTSIDNGNQSQIEDHKHENELYNIIHRPKDVDKLFNIIETLNQFEQLCLIYQVTDNYEYDMLFNQFARHFKWTVFIKIDTAHITTTNILPFNNITRASFIFYKFGHVTSPFLTIDEDTVYAKILGHERLKKSDFIELYPQVPNEPIMHQQAEIQYPPDYVAYTKLIQKTDKRGKLCLIYHVNNTNEYDHIFNDLAQIFKSTVFIKIDTALFTTENGQKIYVATQPKIVFYKFTRFTIAFTSTDMVELKKTIRKYELMNRDNFLNKP